MTTRGDGRTGQGGGEEAGEEEEGEGEEAESGGLVTAAHYEAREPLWMGCTVEA